MRERRKNGTAEDRQREMPGRWIDRDIRKGKRGASAGAEGRQREMPGRWNGRDIRKGKTGASAVTEGRHGEISGGGNSGRIIRKRMEDKKIGSGRELVKTDYHTYIFTRKEYAQAVLIYAALACTIVWLFYRRWIVLLAAVPLYPLYIKYVRKSKAEARRKQLSFDFRVALNSLTVSLRAGRSVENAFPDAARDLTNTIGENQDITKEFCWIAQQIRVSVPMEEVLLDFAGRSGVEDIENFAAVFTIAKRMGGNMAAILKSAAESIGGKIDVEREIESTLAAKKMEQKIMTAMPCGIILYMTLASPGFLDVMYSSLFGTCVMSCCLLAYAAAVWWSGKIVAIEV